MIDPNKLPHSKDIFRLAKFITSYPVLSRNVVQVARKLGCKENVIEFLKLFPGDNEFQSRTDFITRCEDLKIVMKQKEELPEERLFSPQD